MSKNRTESSDEESIIYPSENGAASTHSALSTLSTKSEGCFKFAAERGCAAVRCTGIPHRVLLFTVATAFQCIGIVFAIFMLAFAVGDTCLYDSIIVGVLAFSAGLIAPSPLYMVQGTATAAAAGSVLPS